MATKSTKVGEAFAYWPSTTERRSVNPWDFPRRPWRAGEKVRVLTTEASTDSPTAAVWLEHRDNEGLAFRLEVDAAGGLVSFYARPLAFVGEYRADGTPVVVGTEVDERGLPEGSRRLTATLMRDVPLGQLHAAAVAAVGFLGQVLGVETTPAPRRYRGGTPDEELARFAAAYVEELAKGTRAPLKELAERFNYTYNGASSRRRRCVERGLLTTSGRQGRAGGALTDKAKALLGSG